MNEYAIIIRSESGGKQWSVEDPDGQTRFLVLKTPRGVSNAVLRMIQEHEKVRKAEQRRGPEWWEVDDD